MIPSIEVERLRERFRRLTGQSARSATFERLDASDTSYAFVRFPGVNNVDNAPVRVRLSSTANIETTTGNVVIVSVDPRTGEQTIVSGDLDGQVAAGFQPTGGVETVTTRTVSTFNFDVLKCYSLSTETTNSTEVAVYRGWYVRYGVWTLFNGSTGENNPIDLASLIPGTGLQSWVIVGITDSGVLEAVRSTPISTLDVIGQTQIQEALDELAPGTLPVWGWLLSDGQTAIDGSNLARQLDLRPFLDADSAANMYTNPSVIEHPTLVAADRQVVLYGPITVNNVWQIDGTVYIL